MRIVGKSIWGFIRKYWITAAIYLGLVLLYVYITETERVNRFLFPTARSIWNAFLDTRHMMFDNMFASFGLLIPAIAISLILSISFGVVLGMNKRVREVVQPVVYTFSVVPAILLSPFALMAAPSIWAASIFLIVYGTLWSTLFATTTGIMTIDKRYLDKAATLEIKGLKKLFRVILPAASPNILGGFVNSLRQAFVLLVFAEMFGRNAGMGFFVRLNAEFGLYNRTWAGFIFMVMVLFIVMQLFEKLQRRLLKWTTR